MIVVAFLAGLGIPQMQKAVERSHWAQAPTVLSAIRKACQVYYLEKGVYPNPVSGIPLLNGPLKTDTGLSVSVPEPKANRFIYAIHTAAAAANGTGYCARVLYDVDGSGDYIIGKYYIWMRYDGAIKSWNNALKYD